MAAEEPGAVERIHAGVAAEAAGWRLVPVEPTEEMKGAGRDIHYRQHQDDKRGVGVRRRSLLCAEIYTAMLAAAPVPDKPLFDRGDMTTTVKAFVEESNRIEGILRPPTPGEIEATHRLLDMYTLRRTDIMALVAVYQPNAELRCCVGMDVRVGSHIAPRGGPAIAERLDAILALAQEPDVTPYFVHQRYEGLHPFTDGNGRSGRALWFWMMVRQGRPVSLEFLHHWYYQSLEGERQP